VTFRSRGHYWVITLDGIAQRGFLRDTKRDAIGAIERTMCRNWSRLRREGFDVVKIRIVPFDK
jgi:hypothetical protein